MNRDASSALSVSPVKYLRTATLHGLTLDTNFHISHEQPLRALKISQHRAEWMLGNLPEGHEFLLMIRKEEVQ